VLSMASLPPQIGTQTERLGKVEVTHWLWDNDGAPTRAPNERDISRSAILTSADGIELAIIDRPGHHGRLLAGVFGPSSVAYEFSDYPDTPGSP
jgi:hypothetical protein